MFNYSVLKLLWDGTFSEKRKKITFFEFVTNSVVVVLKLTSPYKWTETQGFPGRITGYKQRSLFPFSFI